MNATAKKPTEIIDTMHASDTDIGRRTRLNLAHRRALFALAAVTLRYQVHNELAQARADTEAERESEMRLRARRFSAVG
jgi:hypothetical protein